MTDELAIGDFVFRQRNVEQGEALPRAYDAVVAGLSWETRGSTALSMLKSVGPELTLFKFASRSQEIEDAKALQLRTFLTRSEEHTSELQSLMRISYAVFCLTKKKFYDT